MFSAHGEVPDKITLISVIKNAFAMLEIIFSRPFVTLALVVAIHALTFLFVVSSLALVQGAVVVIQSAVTLHQVIFSFALVFVAIFVDVNALTVAFIV